MRMKAKLVPAVLCTVLLAHARLQAAPIDKPIGPTTGPAGASGRAMEDVLREINVTGQRFTELVTDDVMKDAAKRSEVAPQALPHMRKMVALLEEVAQIEPTFKPRSLAARGELSYLMAMLGDADALNWLKRMGVSSDAGEMVLGKSWQAALAFTQSRASAPEQEKVLAELTALATAHPRQEVLVQVIEVMSREAATPILGQQIEVLAARTLKGPMAEQLAIELQYRRKLNGLLNKPLVIAGTTPDGKPVSTEQWKGKVVLVDFWATWCKPCFAMLPRVKKVYDEQHDKGLEIIGVSCDYKAEAIRSFMSEMGPKFPWPQVFDAKSPGIEPYAEKYGISMLPTMLLIDKKGIVRSVTAHEDFEQLIPKLLAE